MNNTKMCTFLRAEPGKASFLSSKRGPEHFSDGSCLKFFCNKENTEMKKIIRLFAVIVTATVLMAAACICASAGSAEGASLYASQTSAGKGDEVTFSVSLSGGKNVKALSISITFDSGVFELTSGDWSISEGVNSKPFYTEDAAGALSFKKEVDVEGEIFSFSLKVKDGVEVGNSTVSCVIGIEDGTPVSASSDISIVCKHSFTKEEATEAHLKSAASCTANHSCASRRNNDNNSGYNNNDNLLPDNDRQARRSRMQTDCRRGRSICDRVRSRYGNCSRQEENKITVYLRTPRVSPRSATA